MVVGRLDSDVVGPAGLETSDGRGPVYDIYGSDVRADPMARRCHAAARGCGGDQGVTPLHDIAVDRVGAVRRRCIPGDYQACAGVDVGVAVDQQRCCVDYNISWRCGYGAGLCAAAGERRCAFARRGDRLDAYGVGEAVLQAGDRVGGTVAYGHCGWDAGGPGQLVSGDVAASRVGGGCPGDLQGLVSGRGHDVCWCERQCCGGAEALCPGAGQDRFVAAPEVVAVGVVVAGGRYPYVAVGAVDQASDRYGLDRAGCVVWLW